MPGITPTWEITQPKFNIVLGITKSHRFYDPILLLLLTQGQYNI